MTLRQYLKCPHCGKHIELPDYERVLELEKKVVNLPNGHSIAIEEVESALVDWLHNGKLECRDAEDGAN